MSAIVVKQLNGTQWIVSHYETVIPHGGTMGMTPQEIVKVLSFCESLSKRFAEYVSATRFVKQYFDSLEEFERYEANPDLARTELPLQSKRTSRPGVVYLAQGNGSYKIGRSSSFSIREHQLTTKLPFPVEIVHTIRVKDTVEVERYWHKRFAQHHLRGEWFNLGESEVTEFCFHNEM